MQSWYFNVNFLSVSGMKFAVSKSMLINYQSLKNSLVMSGKSMSFITQEEDSTTVSSLCRYTLNMHISILHAVPEFMKHFNGLTLALPTFNL